MRRGQDDDDDFDEEPLPLRPGHLDFRDDDHDHGAGWLYVPDLSMVTGWASHSVPRREAPTSKQSIGFRQK